MARRKGNKKKGMMQQMEGYQEIRKNGEGETYYVITRNTKSRATRNAKEENELHESPVKRSLRRHFTNNVFYSNVFPFSSPLTFVSNIFYPNPLPTYLQPLSPTLTYFLPLLSTTLVPTPFTSSNPVFLLPAPQTLVNLNLNLQPSGSTTGTRLSIWVFQPRDTPIHFRVGNTDPLGRP